MTRAQLEHIIRASGAITQEQTIVVFGSQSILGRYPDAPDELRMSMEADVFPLGAPYKADLIDGSIGERSMFHDTYGYYAHGVGPETATLPYRWLARCIEISGPGTGDTVGLCLAPVDLLVSKLVAGRAKDMAFVREAIRTGLTMPSEIEETLSELSSEHVGLVRSRLTSLFPARPPG